MTRVTQPSIPWHQVPNLGLLRSPLNTLNIQPSTNTHNPHTPQCCGSGWRQKEGTFSSISVSTCTLAWKIPLTEETGRLPSMGSQSRTRLSDFTSRHFTCSQVQQRKLDLPQSRGKALGQRHCLGGRAREPRRAPGLGLMLSSRLLKIRKRGTTGPHKLCSPTLHPVQSKGFPWVKKPVLETVRRCRSAG